jgi:REP element-mobilizing transposase RayT
MPDHLHWLIILGEAPLHRLMQRVKSRSAIAINRHFQRHEQVWQKGYYDRGLRKEEDLKSLARYVVANPLRAGLVDNIGDYPLWDAIWL